MSWVIVGVCKRGGGAMKVIVIGVDPGIANTGLAVISRSTSGYALLESHLMKSSPKIAKAERLLSIYEGVFRLLETHDCALVSIERCFHNKNVSSSQSTGGCHRDSDVRRSWQRRTGDRNNSTTGQSLYWEWADVAIKRWLSKWCLDF